MTAIIDRTEVRDPPTTLTLLEVATGKQAWDVPDVYSYMRAEVGRNTDLIRRRYPRGATLIGWGLAILSTGAMVGLACLVEETRYGAVFALIGVGLWGLSIWRISRTVRHPPAWHDREITFATGTYFGLELRYVTVPDPIREMMRAIRMLLPQAEFEISVFGFDPVYWCRVGDDRYPFLVCDQKGRIVEPPRSD